ncbi:copper homeostasis protein CutC [Pseudonocardia sp. GCM10023141]|uniref:copper homeostasis protein CutC n=1 Tax=Pseudonocardia sp. GCM10023141 TaxID=3252653 RepID=UPI003615DFB6
MAELEISVDTLHGVEVAAVADRIELCAALAEGGLTPSIGLVTAAVPLAGAAQVHVLVRPRPGGFAYGPGELAVMRDDVRCSLDAGATGVVVGALTADGTLDQEATAGLVAAAGGAPVTFHRAFDQLPDLAKGLDELAELGVDRVLTSGGPANVDVAVVAALVATARLTVMACGGVRAHNVRAVLAGTGAPAVHAAPRAPVGAGRGYAGIGVPAGFDRFDTDPDAVAQLRRLTR